MSPKKHNSAWRMSRNNTFFYNIAIVPRTHRRNINVKNRIGNFQYIIIAPEVNMEANQKLIVATTLLILNVINAAITSEPYQENNISGRYFNEI